MNVVTAPSACNLGVLLEEEGDKSGALAAYRRAYRRDDAHGAFNLGVLLAEQADTAGAINAYDRASRHGSQHIAQMALGALSDSRPTNGGTDHRLQQAVGSRANECRCAAARLMTGATARWRRARQLMRCLTRASQTGKQPRNQHSPERRHRPRSRSVI